MTPDPAIFAFLLRSGLMREGESPRLTALAGGVSSDIWLVELGERAFCAKRALARLRVEAEWEAPVERSGYEAAWLRDARVAVPEAVPALLAEDAGAGIFAMEYLPPERFGWWKGDLLAGRVDVAVARAVGDRLARIHAALARDPGAARRFATDAIFYAIRLEPYLLATARAHPDRAAALERLAARTAATKRTVLHGDVSPKNILVGPVGPVFLDAECAWYGDPAFDLAFCLNHLLLKCLAAPHAVRALLDAFEALRSAYLDALDWEPAAELEERAASLLPGLLLARVDGKSPVEYLPSDGDRSLVRVVARRFLAEPASRLQQLKAVWAEALPAGTTRTP